MSSRIPSLDGLRGVAAVVVVLYHCSLVARPIVEGTDAWAWVTQSPVKAVFAGTEAVLVFFVLSGLVVTIPALKARFDWPAFMASRLVRLYLPVLASLLFAAALVLLVPRDISRVVEGSWSDAAQAREVSLALVLGEASLAPATYDLNNVLWSLRWELIFSVALPAFVGAALLLRRRALLAAVVAIAASLIGRIAGLEALVYLPVFLVGALIAVRLDDVRTWAERPRRRGYWPTFALLSVLLLIGSWLTRPVLPAGSLASSAVWGLSAAGAVGVLLVALGWARVRRALERPVAQWLGRTSFSLYLVHAPILGTLAYVLRDERWWAVALVGVPVSLLVGWAFTVWIEAPSHRLAKHLGKRVKKAERGFRAQAVESAAQDRADEAGPAADGARRD